MPVREPISGNLASTLPADPQFASAGMEHLGQTFLSLVVVVGIILSCFLLFRRLQRGGSGSKKQLKVVSSAIVGPKERVVVVEIAEKWLVLGVAAGSVNVLHKLPKPSEPPSETSRSFAKQLDESKSNQTP